MLTDKQKVFIEEYLQCFNATEAARRAGYKGNDFTLASVGWENLRKPYIAEKIAERLQDRVMSADEVLSRLSEMARVDMADFIGKDGAIDWAKVKAKGYLVKKVMHTSKGPMIELHDAKDALKWVGKHHQLFVEKVEHSGEIRVKHAIEMTDDELANIASRGSK